MRVLYKMLVLTTSCVLLPVQADDAGHRSGRVEERALQAAI